MAANAGAIPAGVGPGAVPGAVAPPQPVAHTIAQAMQLCGFSNTVTAMHPHGTHQFVADEIFGDSFQDVAQVTSSDMH